MYHNEAKIAIFFFFSFLFPGASAMLFIYGGNMKALLTDLEPAQIFEAQADFESVTDDPRTLKIVVAFDVVKGYPRAVEKALFDSHGHQVSVTTLSMFDALKFEEDALHVAKDHYNFYRQDMEDVFNEIYRGPKSDY